MSFDFLGRGIKFPFNLQSLSGGTTTSKEKEHIEESIRQILGTSPGERFMNPYFGSKLKELIFEPDDEILEELIAFYITDAVSRWEKRVVITEVVVIDSATDTDSNKVTVKIFYQVIATQVEGNLVYSINP